MDTTTQAKGSAEMQGALWGQRAADWSQIQEPQCQPLYDAALERIAVGRDAAVVDVGCGAGLAARTAAARGARVSGLDASAPLVAIARERVPAGDFRVGEMEELPFPARAFDAVLGFNSFQYAARPEHALAEARRVARPGAPIVVATWGRPDSCELLGHLKGLGTLMPPPPPGAPGPFALSEPGTLEALVARAGLTPEEAYDVTCVCDYPDLETAVRGLLASGPAAKAIGHSGEVKTRASVIESIEPFRTPRGGYRLSNVFRYLVARA